MEHGRLINKHYSFLTTTSFKALKGAEREMVTRLQDTVRDGAKLAVNSFIHNDFIPYMGTLEAELIAKKVQVNPVLTEQSCLCQMAGGVLGSGNGNVIETFKDFCGFLQDLTCTANAIFAEDSQGIDAVKAQTWVRKWQAQSAFFMKAVLAFEKIALGSAEPETVLSATMILDPASLSDFHIN